MTYGQFQTHPGFNEQLQSTDSVVEVQATPKTPELAERTLLEYVSDIEMGIETLRQGADETTIPRYRLARIFQSITEKFISNWQAETLEKRLVDVESDIGGNLFAAEKGIKSRRFWYYDHCWFYEVVDAIGPMRVMYRVTEHGFEKIVDGNPVAFVDDEEMHLIAAIGMYDEAVRAKLYN